MAGARKRPRTLFSRPAATSLHDDNEVKDFFQPLGHRDLLEENTAQMHEHADAAELMARELASTDSQHAQLLMGYAINIRGWLNTMHLAIKRNKPKDAALAAILACNEWWKLRADMLFAKAVREAETRRNAQPRTATDEQIIKAYECAGSYERAVELLKSKHDVSLSTRQFGTRYRAVKKRKS